jgi:heat shock protein HslJ
MKNPTTRIGSSIKCMIYLFMTGWLITACQTAGSRQDQTKTDSMTSNKTINTAAIDTRSAIPDTTSLKGDWFLQDMAGSPTTDLKSAYIRFDISKSSFTGSTGCNSMKGLFWYSDNDTSLVFGDHFITTKMACPGNDEHALIRSLASTNHYILRNGSLTFLSDGHELSAWRRRPAPQRTAKL